MVGNIQIAGGIQPDALGKIDAAIGGGTAIASIRAAAVTGHRGDDVIGQTGPVELPLIMERSDATSGNAEARIGSRQQDLADGLH